MKIFEDRAENRVVAYLDILGVSATKNFDDLLEILEFISAKNNEGRKESKKIEKMSGQERNSIRAQLTFSSFSDSIVISVPQWINPNNTTIYSSSPKGEIEATEIITKINPATNTSINTESNENDELRISSSIMVMLPIIYDLIVRCLEKGYLVRGSISYGMIYHTKNIVVGSPIAEIVEAEQKIASVPRIIFCKKIMDILSNFELNDPNLIRDNDGIFYLNWVNDLIHSKLYANYELDLSKLTNSVIEGIEKSKGNYNHFRKWCWMANYLNKHIPLYLNRHSSDHTKNIKFEPIKI